MKKLLAVLLASLVIVFAFAGCSGGKDDTTLPEGQVTTEGAVLKETDAIHYIKDSYTLEELGLADVKEEYSFMVASNGVVHDGDNYIRVVANVVTQNEGVTSEDGSKTFSMETVGEYLISFDAKKVLKKDMSTENEYTELENKIPDYSAKGNTSANADK